MTRFSRFTDAFSTMLENLKAAIALNSANCEHGALFIRNEEGPSKTSRDSRPVYQKEGEMRRSEAWRRPRLGSFRLREMSSCN
jgi:hypothetical protein